MNEPTAALTLQMLEWLSARPRKYVEALEAWRTSCPRLSIWEDAWIEGLLSIESDLVVVSPKGELLLRTAASDREIRRHGT